MNFLEVSHKIHLFIALDFSLYWKLLSHRLIKICISNPKAVLGLHTDSQP